MAAQNPHAAKQQQQQQQQPSRQSSEASAFKVTGVSVLAGAGAAVGEASLAGGDATRQLTEVLYGRWVEGLRSRWPPVQQ